MWPAVCLQTDVQPGAPGVTAREKCCPCVHSLKSQRIFAAYWYLNCIWLTMALRSVDATILRFPDCPHYSCWVAITRVLLMLNLLVGDMPSSETLRWCRYMCTHSTAITHKYSSHMQENRQAGYFTLHTCLSKYTSLYVELISLALMLLGAYISEPGSLHSSVKYEQSGTSLKAAVSK